MRSALFAATLVVLLSLAAEASAKVVVSAPVPVVAQPAATVTVQPVGWRGRVYNRGYYNGAYGGYYGNAYYGGGPYRYGAYYRPYWGGGYYAPGWGGYYYY